MRRCIQLSCVLLMAAYCYAQAGAGGVGGAGGLSGIQSNARPQLQVSTGSCPTGTLGIAYSCTLGARFGIKPYTWALTAGSLPGGLSLNTSTGAITGTPTPNAGTYSFTVQVTDSATTPATATAPLSIKVNCGTVTIVTGSANTGLQGTAFNQQFNATGGVTPYTWLLATGSLASGLAFDPTGVLSGTPTLAGLYSFGLKVSDSCNLGAQSVTANFTQKITTNLAITTTALSNAVVNNNYQQSLAVAGGTSPFTWSLLSVSLPTGLSLSSGGVITGTPTTVGTSTFQVKVTDALSDSATATLSINVICTPLSFNTSTPLPNATAGSPYQFQMSTTGGVGTVTYSAPGLTSVGLSISGTGLISGTPTQPGTFSPTISATDSCPAPQTISQAFTLTINQPLPLQIITTSLPAATTGQLYDVTMQAVGGVQPYTWSESGALPAGLTFSTAGELSGTPTTSGTFSPVITVTDALNHSTPVTFTLTCNCTPLTWVTGTNLQSATQNQAYSDTLQTSGGYGSISCSLVSGTLPTGVSLTGCTISGTPTVTGTFSPVIQAKDQCSPTPQVIQQTFSLVVAANTAPLAITNTLLPNATESVPYSAQLVGTGGTPPYTFSKASGSIPAGISLGSNGAFSGTPTATGISTGVYQITDSVAATATKSLGITVSCNALAIGSTSPLPKARKGKSYRFQFATAAGQAGTGTLTWSATGVPAGLTLSSSGLLSGTPTNGGTFTVNVSVTDSCNPTPQTAGPTAFTLVISGATQAAIAIATPSPLQTATEGVAFSQQMSATGGVPPYTWALIGGAFPTGLSMNRAGLISGIATTTGSFSPQIQVTDTQPTNTNIVFSQTASCAALSISTTSLPTATQGSSYSAQVNASGGTGALSYSASGLPTGVTINSATGAITGTPSVSGTFTVTVTVTDSCSPTPQSLSKALSLQVNTNLAITTTALPNGITNQAYSATLSAIGGTPPYTWAIASSSAPLPAGLSLNASTGVISGTPTVTGTTTVTVQVTDSAAHTISAPLSITISASSSTSTDGPAVLPTLMSSFYTTYPVQGGANIYNVTSGSASDLVSKVATAAANCGSTGAVVNIPVATYSFSNALVFTIPPTNCDSSHWLVIQSANIASLPAQGTRVGASNVANMPTLTFTSDSGAATIQILDYPNTPVKGVWIAGLEVTHIDPVTFTDTYPLVQPGDGCANRSDSGCAAGPPDCSTGCGLPTNVTAAMLDSRITLDRMYIHGATATPAIGLTSCIVYDASYFVVKDSTITNCVEPGAESHGIESYWTFGPTQIENNTIEAASVNIMHGAVDSLNSAQIPSDIYIYHNYLHKLNAWISPTYVPKNFIECKNCQRLLAVGNVMANDFDDNLNYAAWNMEPRNAFCKATWSVVQDTTARYNLFQNVTHLTQFLGTNLSPQNAGGFCPQGQGSLPFKRGSFHDNIAENVTGRIFWFHLGDPNACPTTGAACQLSDILINHNSIVSDNALAPVPQYTNNLIYLLNVPEGIPPALQGANVTIKNNIVPAGDYTVFNDENKPVSSPFATIFNDYFGSTWTFIDNVIPGFPTSQGYVCSQVPAGNFNTSCTGLTLGNLGFTNWNNGTGGNYQLTSSSPYKNQADDGSDVGANVSGVNNCTQGVVAGTGFAGSCP